MAGPIKELVVKELVPISKYRIRILEGPLGRALDIREYVSSTAWEGYTRRGIRLTSLAEIDLLRDALTHALEEFPGPPPAGE